MATPPAPTAPLHKASCKQAKRPCTRASNASPTAMRSSRDPRPPAQDSSGSWGRDHHHHQEEEEEEEEQQQQQQEEEQQEDARGTWAKRSSSLRIMVSNCLRRNSPLLPQTRGGGGGGGGGIGQGGCGG